MILTTFKNIEWKWSSRKIKTGHRKSNVHRPDTTFPALWQNKDLCARTEVLLYAKYKWEGAVWGHSEFRKHDCYSTARLT